MKKKCIMVQGTMSNSGKSFLVAGLCRVFAQDGYKVAPFKSQNMALNSYITKDGLEIGRAQAMQAEAAGIEPTVDMNPILLKPTSTMGSQVIIRGKVYQNMKAMDYWSQKKRWVPEILESYHKLEEEYDIIVIEGAGSPAEINLKQEDIVNMGLAELVDAPVLLVGDIDRGGVFASLYGTIALLEEKEQNRIKGMIINKFRGDKKILESGLNMMENLVHKPIIGVVPMENIILEDEDSLSDQLIQKEKKQGIDVAIIKFPHISNFTDFLPLRRENQLSVRYVERKEELGEPQYIILSGTKNTMSDLKWLRDTGLEQEILKKKERARIFGICGGFQMLGCTIYDEMGIENQGQMEGMGLLPFSTEFKPEKTTTNMSGYISKEMEKILEVQENPSQKVEIKGYEIHMGATTYEEGCIPFALLDDGRCDGAVEVGGKVAGTYLHGIFENEWFVKAYFGLERDESEKSYDQFKEEQFDKLANLVRSSLDMKKIYDILNETQEKIQ